MSIVPTKYNDVHFIDCRDGVYYDATSLWSLLPQQILKEYGTQLVKRYTALVVDKLFVPLDVLKMITNFL